MVAAVRCSIFRMSFLGMAVVILMGASDLRRQSAILSSEFQAKEKWIEDKFFDRIQIDSSEDQESELLFNDYQVRYDPGYRKTFRRIVWRAEGPRDNSASLYLLSAKQVRIDFHRVKIKKSGGEEENIPYADLRILGSDWSAKLLVPNVDKGDVVDVSYSAIEPGFSEPSMVFDDIFMFGVRQGVVRLRVCAPKIFPILIANPPFDQVKEETTSSEDLCQSWMADYLNPSAGPSDEAELSLWEQVYIQTTATWPELSSTISRLTNRRLPKSIELIRLVSTFREEEQSKEQTLENVRKYFETGFHVEQNTENLAKYSWELPDLKKVLAYRRCRDFGCYAFLQAVLDELRIPSELYLNFSYIRRGEKFAAHEIYGARFVLKVTMEGKNHWMEFGNFAGMSFFTGLEESAPIDYGFLLKITPGGAMPKLIEEGPAPEPTGRLVSTYDLSSDDGLWSLEEQVFSASGNYFGDSIEDTHERIKLMRRSYPGIELIASKNSDIDGGYVVDNRYSIVASWWQKEKSTLREIIFFVDFFPDYFDSLKQELEENRHSIWSHPDHKQIKTKVKLPSDEYWRFDAMKNLVENKYFRFSREQSFEGNVLLRTYEYQTFKKRIDGEDLEMLLADFDHVLELVQPWSISYQPAAE